MPGAPKGFSWEGPGATRKALRAAACWCCGQVSSAAISWQLCGMSWWLLLCPLADHHLHTCTDAAQSASWPARPCRGCRACQHRHLCGMPSHSPRHHRAGTATLVTSACFSADLQVCGVHPRRSRSPVLLDTEPREARPGLLERWHRQHRCAQRPDGRAAGPPAGCLHCGLGQWGAGPCSGRDAG
jgi:hypothetical protein